MRNYSLTRLAEWDLRAIARHTFKRYGALQSREYMQGLLDCFQLLTSDPSLGRKCESILPGLRGIEYDSHVFFYTTEADRVVVSRILPRQIIPAAARD